MRRSTEAENSKNHLEHFQLFFSTHIPFISFHHDFRATVTVGVPSQLKTSLSLHPPHPFELSRALNLGRCAAFHSVACRSEVSKRKWLCVCVCSCVHERGFYSDTEPWASTMGSKWRPCSKSCLTSNSISLGIIVNRFNCTSRCSSLMQTYSRCALLLDMSPATKGCFPLPFVLTEKEMEEHVSSVFGRRAELDKPIYTLFQDVSFRHHLLQPYTNLIFLYYQQS